MAEKVLFRIRRQDDAAAPARTEEFEVPWRAGLTVVGALEAIRRHPVSRTGQRVAPVAWESACLEEVCGACTMLINGRPRPACSAFVEEIERPVHLEPLSRFPVVRDLVVDRSRFFGDLRRVKAWIPIDGTREAGPGPLESPAAAAAREDLARCIACGACAEGCPQYPTTRPAAGPGAAGPLPLDESPFVGPAALNLAYLANLHPTGALHRDERLAAITAPGGIQCCGNAQVCVEVCPKEIPLTTSIAALNRQATGFLIRRLLGA
ncbi:MAG TPA: succinate dehydrogenase iron-sulfur subunit [Planctomycetota bacterium]|nr:succinate dehydrogenase iron-sulfur subunit [Planctomycetota bacterium]